MKINQLFHSSFQWFFLALFVWACSFCNVATAQTIEEEKYEIKVISTMHNGAVLLRWVPTSYDAWQHGNTQGYQVKRFTIKQGGTTLPMQDIAASKVILADSLLPFPEADWEPMADTSDLAGLAASAIYGTEFTVETADPNDLMAVRSVAQEKDNRFGLSLFAADQSFAVATAMALAWKDETALPGHVYEYAIRPVALPDSIGFTGGGISQNTDEVNTLPAPEQPGAEPGDQVVHLNWSRLGSEKDYTGFQVERSVDGGQTFVKRNDQPILYVNNGAAATEQAVYIDSLPANGVSYFYRIRGLTPFGIVGPASATVEVIGVPAPLEADLYIWEVDEYQAGKHKIKWRFPSDLESEIQGFQLYRSDSREGEYNEIGGVLAPNRRTKSYGLPMSSNYYKIEAIDLNGHRISSPAYLGQIADSIPPAAPQNLVAEVSPDGLMTLTWDANTESDLAGYRVFMSNQENGHYTQLTIRWLRDTVFQWQFDLNTLTEKAYFKVLALDHRENNSPFSSALEVERPDIIPPAAPILKNVEARTAGIYLGWDHSPSTDVVQHLLQRKLSTQTQWTTLYEQTGISLDPSFLDTTVIKGREYVYRMLAEDEAGLQGSSRMFTIRAMDDGIRPPVTNVQARIEGGKRVRLSWNHGSPNTTNGEVMGLYDFQIYRSIGSNDPLRAYASANPQASLMAVFTAASGGQAQYVFMDEELHYGKEYEYRIIARYIDGGQSPMSEVVLVVIQ